MSGEYNVIYVTSLLLFKATPMNTSINDVQITPEFIPVQMITITTTYEDLGGPLDLAFIPDWYVVKTQILQKEPVPQTQVDHRQNDSIDGVDNSTQKMLRNGMNNLTAQQTRICGLPGFCSQTAFDTCCNKALRNCSECTGEASLVFTIFAACLGFAIFVGNSLILTVRYKGNKKAKEGKLDICRSSLAVADILTG